METINNQNKNKFSNWLKQSITARLIMVGALVIILLIPLVYIEDLINERTYRKESVIREIGEQWGNEVQLSGPMIQVPYKVYSKKTVTNAETNQTVTEQTETIEYAYFFPEDLNIQSEINPEPKVRGIYKTTVFSSSIKIDGFFNKPDFSGVDIKEEDIQWSKARIIFETSNLKGVSEKAEISINNKIYDLMSNYGGKQVVYADALVKHKLETQFIEEDKITATEGINFEMSLNINGSEQFRFIPIGKSTKVRVSSNWKDPNFLGEFLPFNPDKLTDDGFDAKWKVFGINRPFQQRHFKHLPDLDGFASGVNFRIPVSEYQKTQRSAKYGFLVISLTFLVFFMIQTISKISIHPFQYFLIGLALTMFYTLLISITEHSSFLKAYLIAGSAVIGLITLYSKSVLKSNKLSLFISCSLLVLYGFIYVIIQLESYSLLVGSIGLFAILAAIMFASRKIEWEKAY